MEELMKFDSDNVIQYLTERKMKLLIKKSWQIINKVL
jgi:hypothetical protein